MNTVKGLCASKGIGIGTAYVYVKPIITIENNTISDNQKETEINIFNNAIKKSSDEINNLISISKLDDQKHVLTAHLEILNDIALIDETINKINNDNFPSDRAFKETVDSFIAMFENIDDEYLKARGEDLKDIYVRAICNIKNIPFTDSLDALEKDTIIISKDLTPSDTIKMDVDNVCALVSELGSKTSHTSIIANNLGIAALVGANDVCKHVKTSDVVIVDGFNGNIIINPDDETLSSYIKKRDEYLQHLKDLEKVKDLPATTLCGETLSVCANAGSVEECVKAFEQNASGIGLFRTEFIYMHSNHFPTEEEQFEIYKDVAKSSNGKYVKIRTLDIGGDKELPYYEFDEEENPFLGLRGIRLCLKLEDIFKVQLRAILRASAFGTIQIMLPMVISVNEILDTKKLIDEVKFDLDKENISYDKNIKVGIMIETPASVLNADELAKNSDFFSIGTNDLTQYILAVDRGNSNIANLYDTFHSAVLKSIKIVIDSAKKNNIRCGMCGEFAGNDEATKLLLGMGLKEFSVSSSKISQVKHTIRTNKISDCNNIFNEYL